MTNHWDKLWQFYFIFNFSSFISIFDVNISGKWDFVFKMKDLCGKKESWVSKKREKMNEI